MLHYINEDDLSAQSINWTDCVAVIERAVQCLSTNEYAQPIKPYLRYKNPINRIIAMPAYVGGGFEMAGIKWIASFPKNIDQGIPRAHSVVILNDSATGQPQAVINTPMLSTIRTASVSGLCIQAHQRIHQRSGLVVSIIGWGPIGKMHFRMCQEILAGSIAELRLYDLRPIDPASIPASDFDVRVVNSWEAAYTEADVFMTCTVADQPYIHGAPKAGSLHLNVSLRDYTTEVYPHFKGAIFVDDWEEVCRERTDIENLHLEKGLQREGTYDIVDLIDPEILRSIPPEQAMLFNPMGMGIFDIAIGTYFYEKAKAEEFGTALVS
ncbi:MAG: 2,3-diaminopropionate biosynthesis protein SbnB [Bacteroidota bacterium]